MVTCIRIFFLPIHTAPSATKVPQHFKPATRYNLNTILLECHIWQTGIKPIDTTPRTLQNTRRYGI